MDLDADMVVRQGGQVTGMQRQPRHIAGAGCLPVTKSAHPVLRRKSESMGRGVAELNGP